MSSPKGYYTPSGYVGFLPNNAKMFFATEKDYREYIESDESEAA